MANAKLENVTFVPQQYSTHSVAWDAITSML